MSKQRKFTFILLQMDMLKLAWFQLSAYPVRTGLTALGMTLSVAGFICIASVMHGMEQGVNRVLTQLGSDLIIINHNYLKDEGTQRRMGQKEWAALQDVLASTTSIAASALVPIDEYRYQGTSQRVKIVATTELHKQVYRQAMVDGRFFLPSDEATRHRVCVVSASLLSKSGHPNLSLGDQIQIGHLNLTIIGIVPAILSSEQGLTQLGEIYIPLALAEELVGQYLDYSFGFRLANDTVREHVIPVIERSLRQSLKTPNNEMPDFLIEDIEQIRESALIIEKLISKIFYVIISIAFFISGISVLNVMLISVYERTREIGLVMALGANKRAIRLQFLFESLTVSLLGAAFGVLLGWSAAVKIVQFTPHAHTPSIPLWAIVSAIFTVTVTALAAGLIPAERAADLDPIQALAHE